MAEVKVVEEKDRNTGIVAAVVFTAVLSILLLFLSVTEPDPPLQDIPVPIELDEEMIIEDFEANAGGGTPANTKDPKPTPPDQGDAVLSSEEPTFTHNTGQEGKKPVENPKPSDPEPDPTFTFSGSGGSEGGGGSGNLFGSGTDNNPGTGSGGAGSGTRKVVTPPCPPSAGTEEGDIYLTVWIDETGKVIKAENIPTKTTTSSATVINAAIQGVKNCMRFEKREGAGVTKRELSGPIRIRRN
ncbi:hypothetical protein GCM10009118_29210 [Wandonia haliotis]|uniref:Energy transducer TonB n=1 Tax=Wandonia haliotis TaxID=574963 RepID=A0ABP3Y4X0_9FLAO